MTPFTDHLSEEEMACHDGTPYPFDQVDADDPQGRTWRETRAELAARLFEKIRALFEKPLIIISFFRPTDYQQRLVDQAKPGDVVASADTSQHPQGRAFDVRPPAGVSVRDFHARILEAFNAGELDELGGLGIYNTFVHCDCRPRPANNHLARWSGETHPIADA